MSGTGSKNKSRPLIALTMGDVAGIGPELIARVLCDETSRADAQFLIVGHPQILSRALQLVGSSQKVVTLNDEQLEHLAQDEIGCLNPGSDDVLEVLDGTIDARAGRAAYEYLICATDLALANQIDAIVTAPLNKAALYEAGIDYPGHTEILAERCGVHEFAMMLHLPACDVVRGEFGLSVNHVTLHTSIRSVPDLISQDAVREKIELMHGFLVRIGCTKPRIGVCALNPHAGENGLFGDEEQRLISPAVETAHQRGLNIAGPIPADALLRRGATGEFDGIVAMYHDQGHIALKLLGFDRAVNVTLGLPIVRTSPSHGTAYDIAWQGKADATGTQSAIATAISLAQTRE